MSTKPRVVLDCNIYLAALLNPAGVGGRCLASGQDGLVEICICSHVLKEVRAIPNHHDLVAKFPSVSAAAVDTFIKSKLLPFVRFVTKVPQVFTYARDPADAPYVDLVLALDAAVLVTRDNDLLSLAVDHSIEAKQFRQLTQNRVQILTPADYLTWMLSLRPAIP